jgi:hypothetical protein
MAALNTFAAHTEAYELLTLDLGSTNGHGALFLHTERASLVIDEDGICRDAFKLDGSDAGNLERCVGAQYIASVDDDGVTGEPAVGGHALLVERTSGGRPAVIKTAVITGVVYADDLV